LPSPQGWPSTALGFDDLMISCGHEAYSDPTRRSHIWKAEAEGFSAGTVDLFSGPGIGGGRLRRGSQARETEACESIFISGIGPIETWASLSRFGTA